MVQLFKSPGDALTFAFAYSSEQYAETQMSKLVKRVGRISSGKGLVGIDGAGQAGLILAQLNKLPKLHQACITARYSLKFSECKTCGGHSRMLEEYQLALVVLREWAVDQISGVSPQLVRQLIIRSFYEKKLKFAREAEAVGMPRRTANDQKSKVWPALKLLDATAQGKVGELLQPLVDHE